MNPPYFYVYKASAGSGKTHQLVLQYLKLALDSNNTSRLQDKFTHILAITFTNKACNEMSERILRELGDIKAGIVTAMSSDLCTELGCDASELKRRANIVHSAILHNYSDLSVCTIDSFMNRIVSTFAHDLGLPVGFTPQIDTSDMVQYAIDNLMLAIDDTTTNKDLLQLLLTFAQNNMEDGRSFQIENTIASLAKKQLFKENVPKYLNSIKDFSYNKFISISQAYREANRQFEQKIKDIGQRGRNLIKESGLSPNDFNKNLVSYFQNLADGKIDKLTGNATLQKIIDDPQKAIKRTSKADPQIANHVAEGLITLYNDDIQPLYNKEYPLYCTRNQLLKELLAIALLSELKQIINGYSRENEVLPISEITQLVHSVSQEDAPFIYERIGNRYNNILIDEFQDTSTMQWECLCPLINNCLASGNEALIVGDGKQAIYRFRQGNVQQFIDLANLGSEPSLVTRPNPIPDNQGLLWQRGMTETKNLDTNFRSRANIVTFNNQFFTWIIGVEPFESNYIIPNLYGDVSQKSTKDGGYVHGFFSSDDEQLNKQIYLTLQQLIDESRPTHYTYSDITILAARNKSLAKLIDYLSTEQLNNKPIPLQSGDSLLLSASPVIQLMLSLLQYLITPDDKRIAIQVLSWLSYLGIIQGEKAFPEADIIKSPTISLPTLLQPYGIDFPIASLRTLPLLDLCESLIRCFRLGNLQTAYLTSFLNAVNNYSQFHGQNLSDFYQWIADKVATLSVQKSDTDAIQLMSIHKAKGLAAPIIIYYNPSSKESPHNMWVEIDEGNQAELCGLPIGFVPDSTKETTLFHDAQQKEQADKLMDSLNRLYVAFTRPRESLYIFSNYKPSSSATTANTKRTVLTTDNYKSSSSATTADPIRHCLYDFFTNTNTITFNKKEHITTQINDAQAECLTYGTETLAPINKSETATTNTETAPTPISYADWHQRISISNHSRAEFQVLAHGNLAATDTPRETGILVHELLSQLKDASDIDRLQTTYHNTIGMDNTIVQRIRQVVQHPCCQRFFDPRYPSLQEASLKYHNEIRRPDRIIFANNEVWIVDFKTGHPSQITKEKYTKQVQLYCDALQQMGHQNISGYLLYIPTIGDPHVEQIIR